MLRSLRNLSLVSAVLLAGANLPALAGDSIQDWNAAKAPAVPELKTVKLDPKTTALLVLDFVKQTCNQERRPRCLDTLPAAHNLLEKARTAHATVIYSITAVSSMADVLPPVAALPSEPHVQASPDKFLGTDLDKLLKADGIKTVIVMGTASSRLRCGAAGGHGLRRRPVFGAGGDHHHAHRPDGVGEDHAEPERFDRVLRPHLNT